MVKKLKYLFILLVVIFSATLFSTIAKADPSTTTKKLYGTLSTEITVINELTGLQITRYYLNVFANKYYLGDVEFSITPDKEVGAWYTCYYDVATDGKTPTFHYCVKGEVDDGKTITIPATDPTPTTPDPSTTTPDPGTTTNDPSTPLTVNGGTQVSDSGIDKTKCPAGAVTNKDGELSYPKGVLKGVSCESATKTLDDVLLIVKNVVTSLLLPIVGVLFIIMLLIGGILYITSAGNQQRIDRGKKILTAAIIGLIIVTLSYTLIAIFTRILGGGLT